MYLCVRHLVISVLISLDQELSENIWFVWSRTCYKGGKLRCHACDTRTDGHTDGNWKVEQYSAETESAIVGFLTPTSLVRYHLTLSKVQYTLCKHFTFSGDVHCTDTADMVNWVNSAYDLCFSKI